MSRNMKIVLAVVGGLLLLGCLAALAMGALGARFFGQAMDPAKAREIALEVTDYELPSGYREMMGFSIMGAKMALIAPEGMVTATGGGMPDNLLIMLMQAPAAAADAADMREQMLQNMGSRFGMGGSDMKQVGTQAAVIRGQSVTLDVSEGATGDGTEVRMLSGVFEGKGGPSLVAIVAPIAAWDQTAVDAFLASMR